MTPLKSDIKRHILKFVSVIVVTGGEPPYPKKAEALNIDGTRLCVLPDLPTLRRYHSMSGGMVCGGLDDATIKKTCMKFDEGKWKEFSWRLRQSRRLHISWARPNGKIRLLGGANGYRTSEIVSEAGSLAGFTLKYATS